MPAESKSLSEFPRALEVLSGALLLISNPSGQDSFDTNSALLTEVAQAMLDVHYTQELGDVSVFDAIKNTRVLSGTTTPTSALGVDGQLYIKYETTGGVDEVVAMYFKKSSAWLEISLGGGNTDYIECTQAQYDAWEQGGTLDPDTLYFITDGQSGGSSTLAGLSDVNLTNPTDGQLLRYNGTSGKWENAGIINDTTASTSSVYSSNKTDTLLSGKQGLITTVSHSITPSASSTVSPFSFYGEYNFSSDIGNKTVLSVVIEGGGSNNAHTYSFVSKRVRIYANANDELTVTLFLI